MAGGRLLRVGVLADELTESEATRRVFLTAGGLLLVGLALLLATVWWWRSTRPEHPALGPLEVMSARRWVKAAPDARRRMVDAKRRVTAATGPGDDAVVPAAAKSASADPLASAGERNGPGSSLAALVASAPAPDPTRTADDLSAFDALLGIAPATVRADDDGAAEGSVGADSIDGDDETMGHPDPLLERTSAQD